MSRGRMEDLLTALKDSGWRLLSSDEYRWATEPFTLEDGTVLWGLESPSGQLLELEFHAFGDLGERTEDLRDILYCVDVTTARRLYFDKRESADWKANLPEFVNQLGRTGKSRSAADSPTRPTTER